MRISLLESREKEKKTNQPCRRRKPQRRLAPGPCSEEPTTRYVDERELAVEARSREETKRRGKGDFFSLDAFFFAMPFVSFSLPSRGPMRLMAPSFLALDAVLRLSRHFERGRTISCSCELLIPRAESSEEKAEGVESGDKELKGQEGKARLGPPRFERPPAAASREKIGVFSQLSPSLHAEPALFQPLKRALTMVLSSLQTKQNKLCRFPGATPHMLRAASQLPRRTPLRTPPPRPSRPRLRPSGSLPRAP